MGMYVYWEPYFCQYCTSSFTAHSKLESHRYIRIRNITNQHLYLKLRLGGDGKKKIPKEFKPLILSISLLPISHC